MTWFEAQIDEISRSRTLVFYGVALALAQALIFYAWNGGEYPARFVFATKANLPAVCWPILPGCDRLHFLGDAALFWLSRIYLVTALGAALAFGLKRVEWGYWALTAATGIELFFYAQDYRFGGEMTYLGFLATFVFLFVPGKLGGLRLLLTAFYLFAGLAHVNPGWISGHGLSAVVTQRGVMKWIFDHGLWPVAATYVVLLTALFSTALLMRSKAAFWPVFAQLIVFHLIAQPLLGTSATGIVLLLISIFPIAMAFDHEPHRITLPALLVLGIYSVLQVLPWVTPGDHLLTGEGRLGAITMYEGARSCRTNVVAQYGDHSVDLSRDNLAPPQWLGCDPYFLLRQIQQLCPALKENPSFKGLNWHMQARRGLGLEMTPVVQLEDVCSYDVRYAWVGYNRWIKR